ncbi:hypothetical protein B7494_g5590 [Chlorociboria aeruginascens]|nr:hypothetical protein B7494_g5590 [Chlorociboria aeruginascens]
MRRAREASMGGTFYGVRDKRKQSRMQKPSSYCRLSLNSPASRHVDFGTGITNSLKHSSTLQRVEPEPPIENVQPEVCYGRPQALSSEEEEILYLRLLKIWEGMMTFRRREWDAEWEDIMRFPEKWLPRIIEHIPLNIKLMLISPHPPTPDQIKSLPPSDTTDAGVFLWCAEPNGEQNSTEKTLYVYIGSASKYPGGLNFRKRHMLSQSIEPHDEGLKLKIKDLDLNPKGEFKTLFIVPSKKGDDGDVMDVRALAILARFVLMIWLGAVGKSLKPISKDLGPWRSENIKYVGLADDVPLTKGLNQSGSTKEKLARQQNKRAVGFF